MIDIKDSKILVTGGEGFLGTALCEKIVEHGAMIFKLLYIF